MPKYDTMEECLASMRPSDELMELLFGEEQGYRQLIEHFEGFEAGGGRGRGKARGASRDQRGGMTGYDSHKLRSEERPLAHDHERLREPSVAYRMIADEEPATAAADELKDLKPLIVCLPLNGVLLHRAQRTTRGSFAPVKRPYLAAFLEYLFAPAHRDSAEVKSDDKGRKIHVVVYTATRAHNVVTLLDGLDLTPSSRATSLAGTPYVVDPAKGDILKLVLSREDLDLGDDYKESVKTIKDLRKVWEKLGIAEDDGARRTVLLTDDPIDAVRPQISHFCSAERRQPDPFRFLPDAVGPTSLAPRDSDLQAQADARRRLSAARSHLQARRACLAEEHPGVLARARNRSASSGRIGGRYLLRPYRPFGQRSFGPRSEPQVASRIDLQVARDRRGPRGVRPPVA